MSVFKYNMPGGFLFEVWDLYKKNKSKSKDDNMIDEYIGMPDRIIVTTYEYRDDKKWHYTMSHVFPGNTDKEAMSILKAHRTTDSFFNASLSNMIDENTYEGVLPYKGGMLILRSKIHSLW